MEFCQRHADKPIASWCKRHEMPLCIECLLLNHRECIHDVEEIKAVRDTVKTEARTLVQQYSSLSEGIVTTKHFKAETVQFLYGP